MVDHPLFYIHFVCFYAQLLGQPKDAVLGRSYICTTNIYIIYLLVLSNEKQQESGFPEEALQQKSGRKLYFTAKTVRPRFSSAIYMV